jgi:hypothetical protein
MDQVREVLETRVPAILQSGWETHGHGNKPAILVHRILQQVRLGPVLRIDHIPALVDDGIGIAEGLQFRSHGLDILAELLFVDAQAVGIPTIPSHRRRWRDHSTHRASLLRH